MRPILSVVTPLFNEQEVVPELVRRVVEGCRSIGVPFEFLVVNDGSEDQTLKQLVLASQTTPELRVVNLFRNFGHMPALSAGLALAKADAVVVLDGDLQDPPEMIPLFFARWKEGDDVVYGLRTSRGEGLFRKKATSVFYGFLWKMTEAKIPRQAGTFCLMDRRVVDVLVRMPERDRYFAGLRAWVGGRQSFVPYERPRRPYGKSRVRLKGLFQLARTAFVSFSKVPLRYVSLFSLSLGFVLFCVGLTAIVVRLFTNLAIPGWATTTTLLGLMGSVHSLALAVISEYIAVIFDEVKARPLFLVREEYARGERISTPTGVPMGGAG